MDRMDFTQGVVRTRVIEKRLLSKALLDRLVEADNIDVIFKILSETEYASSISLVKNYNDYEKALSNELIRVYDLMRDVSKNQTVIDLLALKYDYHNIKTILKGRYLNKDLSYLNLPIATSDFISFYNQLKDGSPIKEDNIFKKAMDTAAGDFEINHDPQKIDLILDRYYYDHLYDMAVKTDIKLFIDYVRDMIDFINIKSFIRLHRQNKSADFYENVIISHGYIDKNDIIANISEPIEKLVEKFKNYRISNSLIKGLQSYEKTGRLTDLEKYMDDYLMELNRSSKYITFGPEPIFSYVLAKEAEIKNLRIIMVSKINNIAPAIISERLRDLYV